MGREDLRKAVESWNALTVWSRRERASERVILTVGGYDDDPRELAEIPAVVGFIVAWAVKTGIVARPSKGEPPLTVRGLPEGMLAPESVDFLLAVLQAASGRPGPFGNVAPCDTRWRRTFKALVRKRP